MGSGSAAPGGGPAAAVRAGPAAAALRWGPDAAAPRGQRKHFWSRNPQNASAEGPPVQPGHVRTSCPLSPASPLLSDHTPDLHSPPRLGLGPYKTARPASLSKKIEMIDKRKNYLQTEPPSQPRSDLQRTGARPGLLSALSRCVLGGKRRWRGTRGIRCFGVGGGGGEGVGQSGPVFPPRLLIQN